MIVKKLCSVWLDLKINADKELISLAGNDYARIDGRALLLLDQHGVWRESYIAFEEWEKYLQEFKEFDRTKQEFLGSLNKQAYNILHDELKKLEVYEKRDKKKELSDEIKAKKDYGIDYQQDAFAIRIREREFIREKIDELQAWYREQGLDIPHWQPFSQITQPLHKGIEDRDKTINELTWTNTTSKVTIELQQSEIERKEKIIDTLIRKEKTNGIRDSGGETKFEPKHQIVKREVNKLLTSLRIEKPSSTLEEAKRLYGHQTKNTYENVNKLYHYKPKK